MAQSRYINKEEEQSIIKDFEEGLNTVELGSKYNRNNTTIGRLLKRNGLRAKGPTSKMKKEEVLEAHKRYQNELLTTIELGNIYNVSERTIANQFKKYNLSVRKSGTIADSGNESFFETIDTEAKAYFLGFIMCDGSIFLDRTTYRLSIEIQEEDKHILEDFVDVIGIPRERIKTRSRRHNSLITSQVNINSNKLCNSLIDRKVIPNKTGNKQVPLGVPKNLMKHTIRGMIDADGSVNFTKRNINLYGGGKMTSQVAEILNSNLELSRKPKVSHYKNSVPRMFISSIDYEKVINYLYLDSNYYLNRKNPFSLLHSPPRK